MSKVICAACDCIWNDVNNRCRAKEINLSDDSYIMTMYDDGRQHFNKCREYKMSDEYKRAMKEIEELFFNDRTES